LRLGRLADSLFTAEGTLQFEVAGGYDAKQRPTLRLSVSGEVILRCQRCLGPLPHRLAIDSRLLLLTAQSPGAVAELEDLDGVPAGPGTDVAALVEDEVLLALPMAPRHAEDVCSVATETDIAAPSSFAALQKLKRK